MVYCFELTEINDEGAAIAMADELLLEAIEVSEATRGKIKKIRVTMSKINMLKKVAVVRRWKDALKVLQTGMSILVDAEVEIESVWNIR